MIMKPKEVIPRRAICLDVETTGLKADADRIVQLACVELLDGCLIGRKVSWLFDPGIPIPADATRVHGIRDQDVRDQPAFKDKAREFIDLIGEDPLVIHNAPFDIGFLNAEMRRADLPPLTNALIDTLPMVRARVGAGRATLDAACRLFGIPLERRKARHDALIDAELLAEVYGHLTGARRRTLFDPPAPEQAGRRSARRGEDLAIRKGMAGDEEGTPAATIPDRGLGAPSQEERASHLAWRRGFGLAAILLVLTLGGCAGRDPLHDASRPASAPSDTRVAIVNEAKAITAEDRVLVDARRDTDREGEGVRTNPAASSPQAERSAPSSGAGPPLPSRAPQDIVDARTLAILATLLGSQPPAAAVFGSSDDVPTGASPMLRLIQP